MANVVEDNPKAPISIATTPRCWEGASPSHVLLNFTLVKQGYISYHFLCPYMTRPWIESDLPDHWQTLYPLSQ